MFKKGDKIGYLKTTLNVLNNRLFYEQFKIKDFNDIKSFYTFDHYNEFDNNVIYLKEFPLGHSFNANDFIPLKENRKLKLKNIFK